MKYFVLGVEGVHGVVLLTRTCFGTLEAAEKYVATVHPGLHPFIVREIKEFQS